MSKKNKLVLKKENRFKGLLINMVLTTSLLTGTYFGFNALKGILELHNQSIASKHQTDLVTNSINPKYEDMDLEIADKNEKKEISQEEHVSKYDFEKLWEINPNIVGVIEGDCFEGGYYPVVATNNIDEENYYLYHSVNNKESSTGSIFSDYQSDNSMQSDVTAIWGHNMHGQDGIMFTNLTNYNNQEYYNKHKTLKYYTPTGEYILEVFAYIEDDPRTQIIGNYNSDEEMINAMKNVSNKSLISTETNIEANDRIMILFTCTNLGSLKDPNNRGSLYTVLKPVWEKTDIKSKSL